MSQVMYYLTGVSIVQCEVCGYPVFGKSQQVIIEGAKMSTCSRCAKLGSGFWEPKSQKQNIHAKTSKISHVKRIPAKKRRFEYVNEDLVVIESFKLIIRKSREKMGYSQEDLGMKIGEKMSVIRKVESGKMVPDHRVASKLEHALKIKLLVPLEEPKMQFSSSKTSKGITLGEIVQLKKPRRKRKNEGSLSKSSKKK